MKAVNPALQILTRPFYYAIIDELDSVSSTTAATRCASPAVLGSRCGASASQRRSEKCAYMNIVFICGFIYGVANGMHRHPCT